MRLLRCFLYNCYTFHNKAASFYFSSKNSFNNQSIILKTLNLKTISKTKPTTQTQNKNVLKSNEALVQI